MLKSLPGSTQSCAKKQCECDITLEFNWYRPLFAIGQIFSYIHVTGTLLRLFSLLNQETFKKLFEPKCGQKLRTFTTKPRACFHIKNV